MSSGVLSGLQNLYKGLRASWVGSIPTHSRQLKNKLFQCFAPARLLELFFMGTTELFYFF